MNAPMPQPAMPVQTLEFRLLNEFQRDFPLSPTPFAEIAARLGSDEATVIENLRRLQGEGTISRVGAVFAPRSVGASTLAALAVPRARLEEVAALVSAHAGVNHNYEREHAYNLWFVATAADEAALAALLADIGTATGCPPIALPLLEEFHIDLGFDLLHGAKVQRQTRRCEQRPTSADERRLIAALQPGLALVPRPFARLADECGMPESALVERLAAWLDDGCIKRLGVVVRHHELGYKANAMVVFDVPDDQVSAVGQRLAREAGVTLCYRRQRHLPHWHHNLFCMVHGRSREEVEPIIERLCRVAGHPCEALFSLRRFKQCGAKYFERAAD
jgi:DNA-binding Lrp family transcriptional regulator